MPYDKKLLEDLKQKAKTVRKDTVELMRSAGRCWYAGSFSQVELLCALLFHHMRIYPGDPRRPDRDRLVVSKGHNCESVYAALGEAGFFPKSEFKTIGKLGSKLQAHVDRRAPGIDFSGGSLGLGLSFALGQALIARLDSSRKNSENMVPRFRVFCLMGDGECDEGQTWEAALAAAHYKVDNLVAVIDFNKLQCTGDVSEIMTLEPFAKKWQAFNWDVVEVDGHDFSEILCALERADTVKGRPHVIIGHTTPAKGVPSFGLPNLHMVKCDDEMCTEAMAMLCCDK